MSRSDDHESSSREEHKDKGSKYKVLIGIDLTVDDEEKRYEPGDTLWTEDFPPGNIQWMLQSDIIERVS